MTNPLRDYAHLITSRAMNFAILANQSIKNYNQVKNKYLLLESQDPQEIQDQSLQKDENQTLKFLIKNQATYIDKFYRQMKKELKLAKEYKQKEVFIEQTNERMKKAERMIDRYTFALKLYKKQQMSIDQIDDLHSEQQLKQDNNFDIYYFFDVDLESCGIPIIDKNQHLYHIMKVLCKSSNKKLNISEQEIIEIWHPILGELECKNSNFQNKQAIYNFISFDEIIVKIRVESLVPIKYDVSLYV